MKAIIIAAGRGQRLRPFTDDLPKCKLPIQGKPLIEHQLAHFADAGIRDVVVVTGYKAEKLQYPGTRRYFNDQFAHNNILFSLMYAAAEFNDELIISYSDILYSADTVKCLAHSHGDFVVVSDKDWTRSYIGRTLHPVEEAEKMEIREERVVKIGKHLRPEAEAEFIGLFKLSKKGAGIFRNVFFEIAEKFKAKPFQQSAQVEKAYVTDLFQELIDRGHEIKPLYISGGWHEFDTMEDFTRAGGVHGAI